jgi:Mrp family chromosome partitioning ATPase
MSDRPPAPRDQLVLQTATDALVECDPRLVSLLRPDSIEAEQYRCLRYSLLRTLTGGRCNIIAVSSATPGSDKTTTAINLAATLEEPGIFKVLLVDADLRTAAVAERLGLGATKGDGLDTALTNWSVSLRDVVRRFPQPSGLAVLPTTARPELAGRLIASPRLAMLLREAREQYDFVVIDTPPLLPTADCRAIAPWMDGFLVVVEAHQTTRKGLEEGLNALREDQMLGLVFCGDDGSSWLPRGGFNVGE